MNRIVLLFVGQLFWIMTVYSQERSISPKFDASSNPYGKIIQDTMAGKRTAKFLINFKQPEVLNDYFISSPCADYAQLSNTRIAQFNDFVEQFLKGSIDGKQMDKAEAEFNKRGVLAQKAEIEKYAGLIEKQGTFTTDANTPIESLICRAKGSLQSIKSVINYLAAIKRVFPSVQGVDAVIQDGEKIIAAYPDNKSLMALIKQNKSQ